MSLPNKTNLLPDRPGIPPMAAMPEPETIDIPALAKAYTDGDIDLICVLGPTASGKTRYAVQLARVLGYAEILSADSRQVYTGMDITTSTSIRRPLPMPGPMSAPAAASPSCAAAPACTSSPPRGHTSSTPRTASRRSACRRRPSTSAPSSPARNASPASTAAWTSVWKTALSRKSRASWTAASQPRTYSGTALSISSLRSIFWGNSPTMRCTSSSRTPSISSPSAR